MVSGTHLSEAVDDYYQRGTSADPLEEVVDECSDYSIMRYTIPKGEAKTPHHELGQVKAIQQCIDMCCDVAGCQYAWIFEGTCYSVTCGSSNMNMCKGKHVQFPSTYIRVRKVASADEDEAMPTEEDLVAVTVDATPSTTMNEMSQTTSDMTTPISTSMMSHHTSNTHRMQMSSSRSPVATPPPTKPPPIGNNHLLHNSESPNTRMIIAYIDFICKLQIFAFFFCIYNTSKLYSIEHIYQYNYYINSEAWQCIINYFTTHSCIKCLQ